MANPPEVSVSSQLQTVNWLNRPYAFLREWSEKLGDCFTVDFKNHGKYALFSHPEAVAEIFAAPPDVLVASRGNRILRPLLGRRSLLLLDGKAHRRQRRLIMPAFHRRSISRFGEAIDAIAEAELRRWRSGRPFAMRDAMQRVSLQVILRVLLGADPSRDDSPLMESFENLLNNPRFNLALIGQLEEEGRVESTQLGRDFQAARQEAYELVDEQITRRRKAPQLPEETVLDMLLAATDEEGNHLSDDELRDQMVTLIATGHETTATALAWAVYWVLSTPSVHRRLTEALDALGPEPTPEEVNDVGYLDAVCRETLRIYPIVPIIARWVAEPCEVGGFALEPGVTVAPAIYPVHHRPEIYEKPDRFAPRRFIDRKYSATEYLPFGGARRRCIGSNLALYEMKLVLAKIFRGMELELADEPPVQPVRRLVTISPANGTRVVVRDTR